MRRKRARATSQHIIILGAPRSGSSLLTEMFYRSGYYIGDNLLPPCYFNPNGYFEDRDINDLNTKIILRNIPQDVKENLKKDRIWRYFKVGWMSNFVLDQNLDINPNFYVDMEKKLLKEKVCLKDPRFSYTLPAWKPLLENPLFICLFREPSECAMSMAKLAMLYIPQTTAFDGAYVHAMSVWESMYESILRFYNKDENWLFLHYDQVQNGVAARRIRNRLGVELDTSFIIPTLNRSSVCSEISNRARGIYKQLSEIANYKIKPRKSFKAINQGKRAPKLSVVLSVKDGEELIDKSVTSILNQTYDNFELLIADDGSKDKTWSKMQDFTKKDSRVRIFKNPKNLGTSKSLHFLIQNSRGEYIARHDHDDFSFPNRFEKQLELLSLRPWIGLVSCDYFRFVPRYARRIVVEKENHPIVLMWDLLFFNSIGGHGQVVFRKDLYEKSPGYQSPYRYAEDYPLWQWMSWNSRLFVMPDVLYEKTVVPESISSVYSEKQKNEVISAQKEALKFYLNKSFSDEDHRDLCDFVSQSREVSFSKLRILELENIVRNVLEDFKNNSKVRQLYNKKILNELGSHVNSIVSNWQSLSKKET